MVPIPSNMHPSVPSPQKALSALKGKTPAGMTLHAHQTMAHETKPAYQPTKKYFYKGKPSHPTP